MDAGGVVVIVLIVAVLIAVVFAFFKGNFSFSHKGPTGETHVGAARRDTSGASMKDVTAGGNAVNRSHSGAATMDGVAAGGDAINTQGAEPDPKA